MNTSLRELFHEVADVTGKERERILAERRIPTELRAELESLFHHDSPTGESLTRRVSDVAREALHWGNAPVSRYCGPYRLIRLLGSGGMGAVYLAERQDGEIEQKVAVKLLRADADQPTWRDRFLRERQLLAYLNHSAIARLLDAGHTGDGRPYLVMEHVDGVSIDAYAEPLDLRAKLNLFLLVCEGVSHAHRHLIVHRDLKPSNILVDSSGQPKLLDFGIAKPLDTVTGETRTVERLLTPQYASPEQLRGDIQTTATDVYSLGAVLHKLLTGQSPRAPFSDDSTAIRQLQCEQGITAPSRLNPQLPRDINHILRKALRYEPNERYSSVEAFAGDIRAFLESRPVQARSSAVWYRISKFLRRYRIAVTTAMIALTVVAAGLDITKRQRAMAQARFGQVRELTRKLLALDEIVSGLHGSNKALHQIVAMSKENLETLADAARGDRTLALEVAQGYSHLARGQGICAASTSAQRAQAQESLRKAQIFLQPILASEPRNPKALLIAATVSHDGMIVAENERRNDEAIAKASEAVTYLDRLIGSGELSARESETVSELFYNIALAYKNLHRSKDGIRYAHRSIEVARFGPHAEWRASLGQSMVADLLRRTGDLEGAHLAIRQAPANLEKARFPNETERLSAWCRVLGREGMILGAGGGLSLNRPVEAEAALQRAFDLLDEWARNDPEDAWSRLLFVSLGGELGEVVSARNPQRALAIYDHVLYRLREVKDHTEARRGEAEILAASAQALRRLNRPEEAKGRIDTALRLLAETKDYPAEKIVPYEAADRALRALGNHLAETGQPQRAAEVFEDLLDRTMLSKPDLDNNLGHAMGVSQIYHSLATFQRRSGRRDRAEGLATLRLELWRHWSEKLPRSGFVRNQFELASRL